MRTPALVFDKWQVSGSEKPAVITVTVYLDAEGAIVNFGIKAEPGYETHAGLVAYSLGAASVTWAKGEGEA